MPVPDWEALHDRAPEEAGALDDYWSAAARSWLVELGRTADAALALRESDRFLLLSALPERQATLTLEFCERSRKRILRALEGVAAPQGHGKHVLVLFESADQYYDYVSNYYPERGEFALSSGMFINAGYGHFVSVSGRMEAMEPTIVHELTHCLVRHLTLPAWLNEGIAVNTEHRLVPAMADPRNALYSPAEMRAKRAAFWNAETIQAFWSGKSFKLGGDGNMLSYDLAQHMVVLCARDYERFVRFANAARHADSGAAAALAHLDTPLENLAFAVLGDGEWTPDPRAWTKGIEQGQF